MTIRFDISDLNSVELLLITRNLQIINLMSQGSPFRLKNMKSSNMKIMNFTQSFKSVLYTFSKLYTNISS